MSNISFVLHLVKENEVKALLIFNQKPYWYIYGFIIYTYSSFGIVQNIKQEIFIWQRVKIHIFKKPIRVKLSFGTKMSYVLLCAPVLYAKQMKYLAWIIR